MRKKYEKLELGRWKQLQSHSALAFNPIRWAARSNEWNTLRRALKLGAEHPNIGGGKLNQVTKERNRLQEISGARSW